MQISSVFDFLWYSLGRYLPTVGNLGLRHRVSETKAEMMGLGDEFIVLL